MCIYRSCLTALILLSGSFALAQEGEAEMYEDTIQRAGLGISNESLLQFFQLRSRSTVDPKELEALIEQLGSEKYSERLVASRKLVGLGPLAIPALRKATSDPDKRYRAKTARECLGLLTNEDFSELPLAMAKLMAIRSPKGSVEALLSYLPFAAADEKIDALKTILITLAVKKGSETHPAILKALEAEMPLLRSVAIDVLRGRGVQLHKDQLRKLLDDPMPTVRLQAALAMARHKEAKAVTALIDLLDDLPLSHGRKAEEFLSALAEEQSPRETLTEDLAQVAKTQKAWQEWWQKSEGSNLLEEVKKRTITPEVREQGLALLEKLGSDDFDTREEGSEGLKKIGAVIAPLLRQYVDSNDPEIRYRVRECLKSIDADSGGPLSPVVARLIAFRKPEGAADALLNYLPLAEDETVAQAAQEALNSVAIRDGKPNPVIVKAIGDKNATIRATAGMALVQTGDKELQAKARSLLTDPKWKVRMKVALAFAYTRDRAAIPVLIDSIGQLSEEAAAPAQDYLISLAGTSVPEAAMSGATNSRRNAWAEWWKAKGESIVLLPLEAIEPSARYLGKIMVISYNYGQIVEYDKKGKELWRLTGLSSPRDAIVLRKNRVLIVEAGTRRISERDFAGKVLWSQSLPSNVYPVSVQRLSNGNNLIAGYNRVVEMTRSGRIVFSHIRTANDIRGARRLKNGHVIVLTSSGTVYRLNRTGKVLKSWRTRNASSTYGYRILANGNVLLPDKYNGHVYEYDTQGRMVWSHSSYRPESAFRLPNGRTIVGRGNSPFSVMEIDRSGKRQITQINTNIQPNHLRAR